MKYVEQSHEALQLIISNGANDVDLFPRVSESHFSAFGLNIHFGILSDSHFVTFENNGEIFNEIFACTNVAVSESKVYDLAEVTAKSINRTLSESFTYEFTAVVCQENCDGQIATMRQRRPEPNTHYLEHTFPITDGAGAEAGVTEIYLTTTENITVETIHSYPNEDILVFSKSIIKPKE